MIADSFRISFICPISGILNCRKSIRHLSWQKRSFWNSIACKVSRILFRRFLCINRKAESVISFISAFLLTCSWSFHIKRPSKNGLKYCSRCSAKTAGIEFTCMAVGLLTFQLLKERMNSNLKLGNQLCPKHLNSLNFSLVDLWDQKTSKISRFPGT